MKKHLLIAAIAAVAVVACSTPNYKDAPLYPFGYGLSYTDFTYSDLSIDVNGTEAKVSFNVTNSGKMDGDEVAQLYLTDVKASAARPQKQLRAFRRVHIRSGETVRVEIHPAGV